MVVDYEGHALFYSTGGSDDLVPGAPAVCFVHGAAMDHSIWTLFARYWAKAGYNVISVDLPGHGQSDGQPLTSIEQQADFLTGLLKQLQVTDNLRLVGHSMGSLIALECATRVGSGARCLAMLGTAYPMAVGQPLLDAAQANDHSSVDMISLYGHSFGSQLGGNPVAGISMQNLAERLMEQAADGVMYTDLSACHMYQRGDEAAASVECLAGFILGARDQMTSPRAAARFAEKFSNSKVIQIPDCGHMMTTEKPELTHLAIVELFAQCDQSAARGL